MSAFTFNVALGQEFELYKRVNGNDPADSAFVAVVLRLAGLEADNVLRTHDTLAAILAASNDEPTQAQYARKTLTDTDLAALVVDDVNHRIVMPFPTLTWNAVVAGDTWRKLVVCYDANTGAGTDVDLLPVFARDLLLATTGQPIVPNGQNVVASFPDGIAVAQGARVAA